MPLVDSETRTFWSSRWDRRPTPFAQIWRFLDVANVLTLMGLTAAVACALLAAEGRLAYSVVVLMAAGVCDLFDGLAAGRLERDDQQKQFGARLDSVVDACSFGLAPVVLMYAAGLQSLPEVGCLVLFAAAVVWRLAYFDTVGLQTNGDRRYFTGLPTTYVALVLPVTFLAGFGGVLWLRGCVVAAAVGLALAMVSTFPVRKPGGVFYVLFPMGAVALTIVMMFFADQFPA